MGDGGHPAEEVLESTPADAMALWHPLQRRNDSPVASMNVLAPLPIVGIALVAQGWVEIEFEVIMGVYETREGDCGAEVEHRAAPRWVSGRAIADALYR